jgi:hypothetical protein
MPSSEEAMRTMEQRSSDRCEHVPRACSSADCRCATDADLRTMFGKLVRS